MKLKEITLRKISTGGILISFGKSAADIIKSRNLDPSDWEESRVATPSEEQPSGDNQGDARPENN